MMENERMMECGIVAENKKLLENERRVESEKKMQEKGKGKLKLLSDTQ